MAQREHLGPIVVLGPYAICLNCNRPETSEPCMHDPWIRQIQQTRDKTIAPKRDVKEA